LLFPGEQVASCTCCFQENKFWEESFKVYERGVTLFKYPHVRDIWRAYLKQFVERWGGRLAGMVHARAF